MAAEIEIRFESKFFHEALGKKPYVNPEYESATGHLSLKKARSPLPAVELDEDSFWLVYSDWTIFVEYALGAYASRNANNIATVYTFSTGRSPSFNRSRGEQHQELGFHNAVFFGVVGRAREDVLETISFALRGGVDVPQNVTRLLAVDVDKRSQIHCESSPDFIEFNRSGQPSFHIEDGRVWCPYEQNVWYTNAKWQPSE